MGKREGWIDVAKGIGILFVVFGHVNRGLVTAGVMPATNLFLITDYLIYTFHMPLFFLLAGVSIRLQAHNAPTLTIAPRLLLIVQAYLVWSTAQLLLQVWFGNYVNNPASLSDLARIFYAPIGQFWFLYALLICHIIFLATFGRAVLIVFALIAFGAIRFANLGIVSIAAFYFPFYAAGLLFVHQLISWRPSLAGFALAVVLFVIGANLNWAFGGSFVSVGALPATCFGMAAVLIGSKLIAGPLATGLAIIGRNSLPIFLAHVIAASGTRVVMVRLGVPQDVLLYIFWGVTAGVAMPMIFYRALSHFNLLAALGFAPFMRHPREESAKPR